MVKLGKKASRYYLAVVGGDARVDLDALKALPDGSYISFPSTDRAESLAGSVSGTILPFSFHPDLHLVVDPDLLEHPEIFFNVGRLDRSLALSTEDSIRLAQPAVIRIAQRAAAVT
jgi:Ala-tRNA(Pro) deacylase